MNFSYESDNKNSMLYWYPKIKDLPIPQPETAIYMFPEEFLSSGADGPSDKIIDEAANANPFGYPVFIRTDQASDKHNWKNAAFVESREKLKSCISETILFNICAGVMGLPFKSIVFRKYIPMMELFKAFHGDMPVNPEIRFFIKNGKIVCHHWYWIPEAICEGTDAEKLPQNWMDIIEKNKTISESEMQYLTKACEMVAEKFKDDGYWSIDFCKSKLGIWYLIDMALGQDSWHAEGCASGK